MLITAFRDLFGTLTRQRATGRNACLPDATADSSCLSQTHEELILRLLHERHDLTLDAIVERVAEEAMLAEQRRGGWVTDIIFWGPPLFRREALAAVHQMLGRSLVLEGEAEGPWFVVPALEK